MRHSLAWAGRILAALAVLALIVWFSRVAEREEHTLQTWIGQLGFWAPLAFVSLLVVCTACGIPDTPFGVAAGALFGFWLGVLCFVPGVLLTAAITFGISRRLLRGPINRLLERNPRAQALQTSLSEHGLKLLTLLRLTPISPVLVNYAAGASHIRPRDFYLGTLALIPGLCLEVYFGFVVAHVGSAATGAGRHSWLHTAAIVAGLLVCGAVVVYVAKLAREAVAAASPATIASTS